MRTKRLAACLGVALWLAQRAASASDGATDPGLPHLAFVDHPPPAPRASGPSPSAEPDEFARRPWEAFPMFALTTPFCRGDALGASRCRDTEAGTSVGGGALYRLTPYVAIGAVASFSWFGAPSASSAYSRSRWVGAVVRGYLLDRGALDPYVEAGFGVGAVDAGYDDGAHSAHSHASGPSTSATVGVDVWVLPYLRVGPALSYRWTWLHLVEQCVDGACTVDDVTTTGGVGSHMSFGLLATFALGREM